MVIVLINGIPLLHHYAPFYRGISPWLRQFLIIILHLNRELAGFSDNGRSYPNSTARYSCPNTVSAKTYTEKNAQKNPKDNHNAR